MNEKETAPAWSDLTSAKEVNVGKDTKSLSNPTRCYVYSEHLDAAMKLPDSDRARLLEAINNYAFKRVDPDFSNNLALDILWSMIRERIDSDFAAYQQKCLTNSDNARHRKQKLYEQQIPEDSQPSDNDIPNPSSYVIPGLPNCTRGGQIITPLEVQSVRNLFFWRNYPPEAIDEYFAYYNDNGWHNGKWPTMESRYENAAKKWVNRSGKVRFDTSVLKALRIIYESAPPEAQSYMILKTLVAEIIERNSRRLLYISGHKQFMIWAHKNGQLIYKAAIEIGLDGATSQRENLQATVKDGSQPQKEEESNINNSKE